MKSVLNTTDSMFTQSFIDVDTSRIVNDIKRQGYFSFEQALNENYVNSLLEDIDFDKILLNTNDVGVVKAHDIRFLTHCLACSKKAYDIITSQKVLEICKELFTDTFRLTNHRIYETSKRSEMPWHTDNNKQENNRLTEKHGMPGLLFLFYLSDVDKNAFQFIRHSHKWSQKYNDEIYLTNSYVETKYGKDILTFLMKKGSLILSDTHGIHRAEPFHDKNYKRITLLFQVDQVGNDNEGHGEKNIVNTEYLKNITPDLMDYLGFGFKRDYPAFPNTSVATLTPKDILQLQKQLLSKIMGIISKSLIKAILPTSALINAKRIRWRFKNKISGK